MDPADALDRELQALDDQLEEGLITKEQHRAESRAIIRDYRDAASEAAQAAADRERDRW